MGVCTGILILAIELAAGVPRLQARAGGFAVGPGRPPVLR